jgi:hypothetical protein
VFAGNTVLRRNPITGRLANPTAVPASVLSAPGGGSPAEIAAGPDAQTVYLSSAARLAAFATAPGTELLKPLAAPLGCVTIDPAIDGTGCQPAVAPPGLPSFAFAALGLDPTGATLYAASGLTAPAVRSFARSAGPPLPAPGVGRARLIPAKLSATTGSTVRGRLVRRHPRSWRALARLQLRLRAGGHPAWRVSFDRRSGHIRLHGGHGLHLLHDRQATRVSTGGRRSRCASRWP